VTSSRHTFHHLLHHRVVTVLIVLKKEQRLCICLISFGLVLIARYNLDFGILPVGCSGKSVGGDPSKDESSFSLDC
jgi:hypothetical protein